MNRPLEKLITFKEAEERYGVSRPTLNRLIVKGVLDAYRPGKKTLISINSLEVWFMSTKIKPRKQLGRPRRGAPRV